MAKKHSLVFFGNEVLATGVSTQAAGFRSLLENDYQIKALVLSQAEVVSRQKRELTVVELARQNQIPIINVSELNQQPDEIKAAAADFAVLVAYGRILPEELIELFPKGIINLHPSLLPKYRGPTPIEKAMLDGAKITGVSLIKLSQKMDAGPIFVQSEVALAVDETKQSLADSLDSLGAKLLIDSLPDILSDKIEPSVQDESLATYTERLSKDDSLVDWHKPAQRLEREVRAYAGWPKSRANIHKHDVILTKVRIANSEADGALIHETGEGWLEIEELIAPSGRKMSGSDFLRGYVKN